MRDADTRRALEARVESPEVIAAAWDAWHARHGGKLGPGPAFREAVAAALRVLLGEGRGGEG